MLDSALLLTLLAIAATALVAAVLTRRRIDACLRLWRGFPVRLVGTDGAELETGLLSVYGNALKLGRKGEPGLVVFEDEFGGIGALLRLASDLSPEERRARAAMLARVRRPSALRRMRRALRMWLNATRDAIADALGALAASSAITGSSAQRVRTTGAELAAAAYDPLLEAHLGELTEVERSEGGECRGMLQEYSSHFLCLVDADWDERQGVDVMLPRGSWRVRRVWDQEGEPAA